MRKRLNDTVKFKRSFEHHICACILEFLCIFKKFSLVGWLLGLEINQGKLFENTMLKRICKRVKGAAELHFTVNKIVTNKMLQKFPLFIKKIIKKPCYPLFKSLREK